MKVQMDAMRAELQRHVWAGCPGFTPPKAASGTKLRRARDPDVAAILGPGASMR